ncbi:N-terminal nucleophile aminohydrolases (Ntn hydrolases) [Venustampulla echinocandica]|uniref:N-terminal nucleophile aminohydrolases (Ntn hydrolases) n=1 Tax=Venustampulla echinocandica TaxID=2656787 RepID=A0A370TP77_9HELO|nr:N-terminal nucleophile aminohydrolases (Ntn hydrolases) [Venustampulla echinocandica]RDL37322.1 N-terminal nucleophile aminohydrolases (Ntn hydrolases) [Venustampulla echinocandica]
MQQDDRQHQHLRIPNRLRTACERLRRLRRYLSNPFRRPQKPEVIIVESLLVHPPDRWSSLTRTPNASLDRLSLVSIAANPTQVVGGDIRGTRPGDMADSPLNVSAVFVHAGAGYHSNSNEHIHLSACNDAAKLAMQILKSGGTAVDAVEGAVKVLEDNEITNAGYGSNLSIEGIVEGDATIADHLGRSGACGAVAQIKNPIHLARVILKTSNEPLSLRRIPPNLLVGQGATDFAYEHGIPVVPHDMIVSKNARERFVRWRQDLRDAEGGRMTPSTISSHATEEEKLDREYEERVRDQQRRDHTNAMSHGTWNEGQPDSPQPSPGVDRLAPESRGTPNARQSPSPSPPLSDQAIHKNGLVHGLSPDPSPSKRPRHRKSLNHWDVQTHSPLSPNFGSNGLQQTTADGQISVGHIDWSQRKQLGDHDGPTSPRRASINEVYPPLEFVQEGTADSPWPLSREADADDNITDTVGAIAIDMYGNIAAASSSGGIGMKHRGRVGPAALIGIGTAVIPLDEQDEDRVSVAAVTSGTGEHMATTMASQKCAERLYHNTKRAPGGTDMEATEEEAMESFVRTDFMSHPGVKSSVSTGAIGVMAVKKTTYGYFLHFAHNTDSFALASMHSNEKEPKCVMSRIGDRGKVVQGGRKIRID